MFGVWIRPFCIIRSPHPPYLFSPSLSGPVDGIMQAEQLPLRTHAVVVKSHLEFSGDCDVDLGTKRWSGGKKRKVVLSYPNREEMEWVWLWGQEICSSPAPQIKTLYVCSLCDIPPQSLGCLCKEIQKCLQKSYKRPHYAPNSEWCDVHWLFHFWFRPSWSWDRRGCKGEDHPCNISWDISLGVDTTLQIWVYNNT